MTETRWLDEREARMWRSYVDMARKLDITIERQLLEHELSHADYSVLAPLSEAEGEMIRARELGRQLAWDRSRLSHHLRRMEQRGLISRLPCDTDARGKMVRLTSAGRKAVESAAPGHVETVRRFLVDRLDAAERDVLTAIATRVLTALEPATAAIADSG